MALYFSGSGYPAFNSFLLAVLYLLEEATAFNKVIELENNLNKAGSRYDASFSDVIPDLSFFRDAYKLFIGEKKQMNPSKE